MNEIISKPVLVLAGPTAIGKTALSLTIAKNYDCEVVSVDSMQVYRYMDIGTAKVTTDEKGEIPHHLIDIVDPDEDYDAARFAEDALQKIRDIHARNRIPLLTGGTGLYFQALFSGIFSDAPTDKAIRERLCSRLESEGRARLHAELRRIDENSAVRIHENDTQRLLRALEIYYVTGKTWSEHLQNQYETQSPISFQNVLKIGLKTPREFLYQKINQRSQMMFELGLVDEVQSLLQRGYNENLKSMNAIGYRHAVNVIKGMWSREKALELLARDTRRYAKRQYTWFTADRELKWFEVGLAVDILQEIELWLNHFVHI